jgi:hypothetical protein
MMHVNLETLIQRLDYLESEMESYGMSKTMRERVRLAQTAAHAVEAEREKRSKS